VAAIRGRVVEQTKEGVLRYPNAHYYSDERNQIYFLYTFYSVLYTSADTLNPKICPNCNEGNTQDARFCSKCRMIMSYEGYQDTLELQKGKEDEIADLKKRQERFELLIQSLIDSGQLKPTLQASLKSTCQE
jgi:integrase/recombinase XerD